MLVGKLVGYGMEPIPNEEELRKKHKEKHKKILNVRLFVDRGVDLQTVLDAQETLKKEASLNHLKEVCQNIMKPNFQSKRNAMFRLLKSLRGDRIKGTSMKSVKNYVLISKQLNRFLQSQKIAEEKERNRYQENNQKVQLAKKNSKSNSEKETLEKNENSQKDLKSESKTEPKDWKDAPVLTCSQHELLQAIKSTSEKINESYDLLRWMKIFNDLPVEMWTEEDVLYMTEIQNRTETQKSFDVNDLIFDTNELHSDSNTDKQIPLNFQTPKKMTGNNRHLWIYMEEVHLLVRIHPITNRHVLDYGRTDKSKQWTHLLEYSQIPIALVYSGTIHKFQGMSLSEMRVSLNTRNCFEYGQAYVTLSRARTLEGLRFTDFDPACNKVNPLVRKQYELWDLEDEKRCQYSFESKCVVF